MSWAAVIGSPVGHSLSPVLHRAAWASLEMPCHWEYHAYDVTADTLPTFLAERDPHMVGLSVTMPLKQAIITHLDAIDPQAHAVGAVNTVIATGHLLTGFNTDVHGIITALTYGRQAAGLALGVPMGTPTAQPHTMSTAGTSHAVNAASRPASKGSTHNCEAPEPVGERALRAVILGGRATAASSLAALGSMGISDIALVARRHGGPGSALMAATRLGITYEQIMWNNTDHVLSAINTCDILISTMPAGVTDELALRIEPRSDATLLDVVYSPWQTPLVKAWQQHGAHTVHGTEMLLHQAAMQVRLMTGRDPDTQAMRHALMEATQHAEYHQNTQHTGASER